ncbi:MAG: shikimate kinase [Pseudomonadota bacterium]
MQLKRWIVLVGMMGCGKTSIGQALSRELALPVVDTDTEIEKAAAMSIAEIFERDGEAFFRQKEGQVLARLLEGAPAIMSTGGGAFLAEGNRELLLKDAYVVWLNCDLETLWARVKGKDDRPLLQTEDPKGTLAALLDERLPVYEQAHINVSSGQGTTVQSVIDDILSKAKAAQILEA